MTTPHSNLLHVTVPTWLLGFIKSSHRQRIARLPFVLRAPFGLNAPLVNQCSESFAIPQYQPFRTTRAWRLASRYRRGNKFHISVLVSWDLFLTQVNEVATGATPLRRISSRDRNMRWP